MTEMIEMLDDRISQLSLYRGDTVSAFFIAYEPPGGKERKKERKRDGFRLTDSF